MKLLYHFPGKRRGDVYHDNRNCARQQMESKSIQKRIIQESARSLESADIRQGPPREALAPTAPSNAHGKCIKDAIQEDHVSTVDCL